MNARTTPHRCSGAAYPETVFLIPLYLLFLMGVAASGHLALSVEYAEVAARTAAWSSGAGPGDVGPSGRTVSGSIAWEDVQHSEQTGEKALDYAEILGPALQGDSAYQNPGSASGPGYFKGAAERDAALQLLLDELEGDATWREGRVDGRFRASIPGLYRVNMSYKLGATNILVVPGGGEDGYQVGDPHGIDAYLTNAGVSRTD